MISRLRVGSRHTTSYVVPANKLVRDLYPEFPEFTDGQPVLATGFMVGLLERPCMAALRAHLPDGDAPVGTMVDIQHCGPTVPGMTLNVTAELTVIDGSYHEFHVTAVDNLGDVVARGRIGQTVVSEQRFQNKLTRLANCLLASLNGSAPQTAGHLEPSPIN